MDSNPSMALHKKEESVYVSKKKIVFTSRGPLIVQTISWAVDFILISFIGDDASGGERIFFWHLNFKVTKFFKARVGDETNVVVPTVN